jgi:hypothetical protein
VIEGKRPVITVGEKVHRDLDLGVTHHMSITMSPLHAFFLVASCCLAPHLLLRYIACVHWLGQRFCILMYACLYAPFCPWQA